MVAVRLEVQAALRRLLAVLPPAERLLVLRQAERREAELQRLQVLRREALARQLPRPVPALQRVRKALLRLAP